MDRFVSQFTNRLDAKGRVSIPAAFRAVLAKDGYEGLYVHPALDLPAVDCGGHALLKEIDSLMADFPVYSEERDILATALMGASEILKVDGEGRFVLTDRIREAAGISGEVTFVGVGHKFQIWEPSRLTAHFALSREKAHLVRKSRSPNVMPGTST